MRILKKYNPALLCILLIGFLLISCNQEQEVNWNPTFDSQDKIPFGTYILRNELTNMIEDSEVENINIHTGSFFENNHSDNLEYNYTNNYGYIINGTYMFFYNEEFHDTDSWNHILDFVGEGNEAFISNREWDYEFQSQLGFSVEFIENEGVKIYNQDSTYPWVTLSTTESPEHESNFSLNKGMSTAYFSAIDSTTTEVLGYVKYKDVEKPNYIRVQHNSGFFYLHAEPFAFTNYHMLKEDHFKYVSNCFSYFQPYQIYWDNRRIIAKQFYKNDKEDTLTSLSFIYKHRGLRWAFLSFIAMAVLYILFNYKRKQRAVKLITPYSNYTIDFAKSVATLYEKSNNNKALYEQKANFFLDMVRQKYNIPVHKLDEEFVENLSHKSGVRFIKCQELVGLLKGAKENSNFNKKQFYILHQEIEQFNRKTNLYGSIK